MQIVSMKLDENTHHKKNKVPGSTLIPVSKLIDLAHNLSTSIAMKLLCPQASIFLP